MPFDPLEENGGTFLSQEAIVDLGDLQLGIDLFFTRISSPFFSSISINSRRS